MAKYESLLNDLSTLESQITILKNQYGDLNDRNKELDIALEKSKQDNTSLYQRISSLEEEINYLKSKAEQGFGSGTLNDEEREEIKLKIKDLITRINFHLSAEGQV
jgi:chromosome segregation ATPase